MIVLATTIFFCHSLIRLCMLILHPPPVDASQPSVPNMVGPEGFNPVRPIRVHLARDEELADANYESDEDDDPLNRQDITRDIDEEKGLKLPPPAYGLWRSSVRVDPNLLHWQRVEDPSSPLPPPGLRGSALHSSAMSRPRNGSVSSVRSTPDASEGPRPPSYASEDGVSSWAAGSTAPTQSHTGISDIHPAWRPGYAVSQVPMEERRR